MWIQLLCLMQLQMNEWHVLPGTWHIYRITILSNDSDCSFMWLEAYYLYFHPVSPHRWTSPPAGDFSALRPLCSWSLGLLPALSCLSNMWGLWSNVFSRLWVSQYEEYQLRVLLCDWFHIHRLSYVTQQVPWLHMLYAAIGAVIYTLVSLLSHEFVGECFWVL